ncbi:hypothetical protein [Psychrobacillus sp.]|uniref:hypothetical protein n=1 Tax=Psychrobacillus sp. TaxID=1871623 RepID=UPI0028BE09B1|nr:hypothetical protein [Psychrobacillus sp.]
MTTKSFGKSANNLVHINRSTIAELDEAISELESRGYELVKRDDKETISDAKDFHYRASNINKWKYTGNHESVKRCRAVMKRIMPDTTH